MLTSNRKGAIAETAIVLAATRAGIDVYRPVADGGRCDLVFDVSGRLLRIQCKWAAEVGSTVAVRCYSSRRCAVGMVSRRYSDEDVDAIAAYSPERDRCYVLPLAWLGNRREVRLRTAPTANGQLQGVHWAADFELERLHWVAYFEGP